MRQGFFKRPELALIDPNGPAQPVMIWGKWNVPIIGLFKTGMPFEMYWPRLKKM